MAANGISTLAFKNRRQNAKHAAASTKRATTSRRSTLNINQLPTKYGVDNNSASAIIQNDHTGNPGGLMITGRPWT